jgi:hypothetical protein
VREFIIPTLATLSVPFSIVALAHKPVRNNNNKERAPRHQRRDNAIEVPRSMRPQLPAQYPMKNTALTTERFVLPFAFEAVSDSKGDMTAVMQDASQDAAIMPQPASKDSLRSSTLPIRGGMMSARTTWVRFRGKR